LLALWLRSYWWTDVAYAARRGHLVGASSGTGSLLLMWSRPPPEFRRVLWDARRYDVAVWQQVKHLFVFDAGDSGGDTLRLQVPHWSLAATAAVLPWMWFRKRRAAIRKRRTGLCRRCGYDLRATPGRCPECGQSVRPDVGSGELVATANGDCRRRDG